MSNRQNKPGVKRGLDFDNRDRDNRESRLNDVVKITNDATPTKKKKKKDISSFFASPAPSTSTAPAVPVVTPPEFKYRQSKSPSPGKKKRTFSGYVPAYIHKNVGYVREGETDLDPTTQKVFELVDQHYIIPEGFENNRKYGPISGVSFEQRVIASYSKNLLDPKKGQVEICTQCAELDHKRNDCPTLL